MHPLILWPPVSFHGCFMIEVYRPFRGSTSLIDSHTEFWITASQGSALSQCPRPNVHDHLYSALYIVFHILTFGWLPRRCSIRTEGHPGRGIHRAAISDAVGVFGSGRRRQRGGNLKPAISCIKSTYRMVNIIRLTRALHTLYLSHGTGICDEVESSS